MTQRVFKKIQTPFDACKPDIAVMMVNLFDPQVNTVKVFLSAVKDRNIPYIIVANKSDLVGAGRIDTVKHELGEDLFVTSLIKNEGIQQVSQKIKEIGKKRIVVLGIFNSGKSSLIKALTGYDIVISDIPGTTLSFNEYEYGDYVLIDSVGQIIDINKPLMVSLDFDGCTCIEDKIKKVFSDIECGIHQSCHRESIENIKFVIDLIKKRVKHGNKIVTVGAGASALVAKEIAGQATETGIPAVVFSNDFSEAQPVTFSQGIGEASASLAGYISSNIAKGDVVIAVSASGGTYFVYKVLELARKKGAYTVAITENPDTPLGHNADYIIKSNAKPEGPSSSKIQAAHLTIGYALMLVLADDRGITADQSIGFMLVDSGEQKPGLLLNKKMGIK